MSNPKSIFDGEPAGREETKAFCDHVQELKKYPGQGLLDHYYFAIEADRVFILNMKTFHYIMTTKLTLHEFWPVKVREMEEPSAEAP
jgi:hypothetical protein